MKIFRLTILVAFMFLAGSVAAETNSKGINGNGNPDGDEGQTEKTKVAKYSFTLFNFFYDQTKGETDTTKTKEETLLNGKQPLLTK